MTELNITKYFLDKETFESCFIFEYKINKDLYIYNLKYPSNPLIDIEILKLVELDFSFKIDKLKKIIKGKEYSFKSIKLLTDFILWIEEKMSNNLQFSNIRQV